MPVKYKIYKSLHLISSEHHGTVADDEFLHSYKKIIEHPDFDPTFIRLVDLRSTDSKQRSEDALRTLGIWREQLCKNLKDIPNTAFVAPSDLTFGLVKMFEKHSGARPGEFNVFRDYKDALSWLGLSQEQLQNNPPIIIE